MSDSPIFIVSQHRTGSTLLKNVLGAHQDVTMAFDEMNLYEYFRSNTLDKVLERESLNSKELSDSISKGEIYGTFWKDFSKSGISYDQLQQKLSQQEEIDPLFVIEIVLQLLKENNSTTRSGVKYPVHFRKLGLLLKKFTYSKVLFLTRHPAAIIASKLNDPATRKRKSISIVHRLLVHYFTVFYFSFEFVSSIRTYRKYKKKLMLVRYEDLVLHNESTIKKVCLFCDLGFKPSLMNAGGKESSHGAASNQGMHTESLKKYENVLGKFDLALISLITRRSFKMVRE